MPPENDELPPLPELPLPEPEPGDERISPAADPPGMGGGPEGWGAPPAEAPGWPPWGIGGSLAVVGAFAVTQLLVSVAVLGLLRWVAPGWADAGADAGATARLAESRLLLVSVPLSLFVSHLAGWLAIFYLLVGRHRIGLPAALRLGRPSWRPVLGALFSGVGLQVLAAVMVIFFPPPPDFESPVLRFLRFGPWATGLLFVMAVLMAPALEEAMFRGLLFPALRRRYGFALSAFVVTALFTALHATQTGSYLPPLVGIAFCGWFLARWRETTGSLWPPLALHVGFNLTAFLPLFFLDPQWQPPALLGG